MAGVSSVRPGFVAPVKAVHPDEALHKTLHEPAPDAGDASSQRQLQQAQSSFGGSPVGASSLRLVSRPAAPADASGATPPSPLLDPSQSSYAASNLAQATPALSQIGKLAQQGPVPQLLPSAPVSQIHAGAPADLKPTQLVPGASQLSSLSADVQRQMRMQIAA